MADLLNKEQVKNLQGKDWAVKPDGASIKLYADEFDSDVWEQYAEILGFNSCCDSVEILAVGTKVE